MQTERQKIHMTLLNSGVKIKNLNLSDGGINKKEEMS